MKRWGRIALNVFLAYIVLGNLVLIVWPMMFAVSDTYTCPKEAKSFLLQKDSASKIMMLDCDQAYRADLALKGFEPQAEFLRQLRHPEAEATLKAAPQAIADFVRGTRPSANPKNTTSNAK